MSKTDVAVDEGRADAVLNLLRPGGRDHKKSYPGMHTVVCSKVGETPDEKDMGFFLGCGYKVLSKEPSVTGHDRLVLMGIEEEHFSLYERQLSKETNAWRTEGKTKRGDATVNFEQETEGRSLDELDAWTKS